MYKKFMRLSIVQRFLAAFVLASSVMIVAALVAALTAPPFCYSACKPSTSGYVSHAFWQIATISTGIVVILIGAALFTAVRRSRTGRPPLA